MKRIIIFFFVPVLFVAGKAIGQGTTSFDVDGVKVIFKPTPKQIVSVSVYFRGGTANYTQDREGIENLALNGALDCGTAVYPTAVFKDKADLIGAKLGATAGLDASRISLNCIAKYFNEGWDLLASAVTKPVFAETDLNNLKEKTIGGLKAADANPDSRLHTLAMTSAFEGTPYAMNPAGTMATIGGFTAQQVKDYYFQTLLSKSRIFIVVVGNVDKDDLTAKIKAAFGGLSAGNYTVRAPAGVPSFGVRPLKTEDRSLATNYIMGIVNAPAYSSEDYVPFLLSFWELRGIIYQEIRTKRNLSYAPSATVHDALMPYADVYVSTSDPKQSVAVMCGVLKMVHHFDMANRSLDQIKALYITGKYLQMESSDAVAESLGKAEVLGGWELAEQLPALIQKVTRDEINDAYNKYVTGIEWVYLGDISKAQDAAQAFGNKIY